MNPENSMGEKRPTIRDVAQLANVSVATVSRVFNGKDRVSSITRQKVRQAMAALNYRPSAIAASMITGRTKTVLVMIPDFENPYYSRVLAGIEARLRENDYCSMVLAQSSFSSAAYEPLQAKFDKVVDGIIAIPEWNPQFYKAWNKPCVMVDRYLRGLDLNAVLVDNYRGARILTEELVRAGHQKIAIISGKSWITTILDRLEGYRSVLREHAVPIRPEYIVLDKLSIDTGYRGLKQLMDLPDPPTAVVAANNLICIGCIQACQELQLQIGQDISLVGYDDHELARYVPPGITVVNQPAYEMGEQAADNLLAQLNGGRPPRKRIMDVELIRRGSVKQMK